MEKNGQNDPHLFKILQPYLFANVENKSSEGCIKQETVMISDVGWERRKRNLKTSTFFFGYTSILLNFLQLVCAICDF